MHSAIGGIYVVDKLPSSDHLPLVVTFSMKVVDNAMSQVPMSTKAMRRVKQLTGLMQLLIIIVNMLIQLSAAGYSGMYAFQMHYCANTLTVLILIM